MAFNGVDYTEPAVLPFDSSRGTYNTSFAENLGEGLDFTGVSGIVYNSTGGPAGNGEYVCNSGDYLYSDYFRTISADATEVSVFAWTKSAPTAYGMIVTHYDTNSLRSWSLESINGGAVKVLLSSTGTGVTKSYTTSDADDDIDDNTWHHVGFTYDNNTLIIYIDGVNVSVTKTTDTAMTTIYNPTGWGVGICARGNVGSWLGMPQMRITDVLIANRTLTADEVGWIYTNGLVEDSSCSYSGSGDWVINLADNCNTTTNVTVENGHDINITDVGTWYIDATVSADSLNNFTTSGQYIKMNTSNAYLQVAV